MVTTRKIEKKMAKKETYIYNQNELNFWRLDNLTLWGQRETVGTATKMHNEFDLLHDQRKKKKGIVKG